jgi:hypothetical protein
MTLQRIASAVVGGVLTLSGAAASTGVAPPAAVTTETLQIFIGALLLGYTLGAGAATRATIAGSLRSLIERGESGGESGGGSGGGGGKSGGAA